MSWHYENAVVPGGRGGRGVSSSDSTRKCISGFSDAGNGQAQTWDRLVSGSHAGVSTVTFVSGLRPPYALFFVMLLSPSSGGRVRADLGWCR